MPLQIDVTLTDAVGGVPADGGTWHVSVSNSGTPVADTGTQRYSGALLSAMLPVGSPWTHLNIDVTPDRYAPVKITLSPSTSGATRNDTLARISALKTDAASIEIPLLRVLEATGYVPASNPTPGSPLAGPWLTPRSGFRWPSYRELAVTPWLLRHQKVVRPYYEPPHSPLRDPDAPGWGRFVQLQSSPNPFDVGALMLLEYGEVGSSNPAGGPRFLIGIWVPTRTSSAKSPPDWRDVIAFIHPKTARNDYPFVAYPFRGAYPYAVTQNPNIDLKKDPHNPDFIWQPYVNLALKYPARLSQYHSPDNEAVFIMPVLPNTARPGSTRPDSEQLEYGLPFRTPAGLARLIHEVNLFLHRIRYGFSGVTLDPSDPNIDRWWGEQSRIHLAPNTFEEVGAPTLRKIAVAGYSASSVELYNLLAGERLANGRYPDALWGVPAGALDQFNDTWRETWCLDLLTGTTTVRAAVFEKALKDWVDGKEKRSFLIGGSGTTGHDDPDNTYPILSKATIAKAQVKSSTVPSRHASFWVGPSDKWAALFCTNAYLSASTQDASLFPFFPVSPTDDEAHGFMFEITSGLAFDWTLVGIP